MFGFANVIVAMMLFYSVDHLTRKSNSVKSCGCLKTLSGSLHKDWNGHGEISGTWWRLHAAREDTQTRRMKVPFKITIKYMWHLFLRQNSKCALSGVDLNISNVAEYNTASIDRIDSSKGYINGNVQWVHKHVNFMKRTYSQDYFVAMCKKIADNN